MKLIILKIMSAVAFLTLVSCASNTQQSSATAMTQSVEPDVEESAQVEYLNYVIEIEEAINDKSLNGRFITQRSLNTYIKDRDIFEDHTLINEIDFSDLIIQKIINMSDQSDVWYFDTVYSLTKNYITARYFIYYDDGNMESLDIYLDKDNYSILDVLVGGESFSMTDKIANIVHVYNKPVYNSISKRTTMHLSPNSKAPILKPYYPEEQREFVKVLSKIQDADTPSQIARVYENLNEKYKTLQLLEFIELKVISDDFESIWLYGELLKNTNKQSDAMVFFTWYFYNLDDYEQFMKYSNLQNAHYKQSLTWYFYQFIIAKIIEDDELVNEYTYQILTRYGAFDFVYYLMATQHIRMDKLEIAYMIETAMQDRYDYLISDNDLESIQNGQKYKAKYR